MVVTSLVYAAGQVVVVLGQRLTSPALVFTGETLVMVTAVLVLTATYVFVHSPATTVGAFMDRSAATSTTSGRPGSHRSSSRRPRRTRRTPRRRS
jgi:hypothetical protein